MKLENAATLKYLRIAKLKWALVTLALLINQAFTAYFCSCLKVHVTYSSQKIKLFAVLKTWEE